MAAPKQSLTQPPSGQPITQVEINGRTYRLVPDEAFRQLINELVKHSNDHEKRIAAREP